MGIHQYQLELVPRSYFGVRVLEVLPAADLELGQDAQSGWWSRNPPSPDLIAAVRILLPIDQSWGETEEYVSVGDWNSDLRIWKDGGKVWSIVFRFSPITEPWALMKKFLAIARSAGCVLIEIESGFVIEPEDTVVQQRFAVSRAARFLVDPAGTLAQAATPHSDDTH